MKSLQVARDALGERHSDEPGAWGQIASTAARATTTSREERLIKVGLSIGSEPPSGDDMTFTHAVFCQVGLPRAKVSGREFVRKSGSVWLSVQAGLLDEGNGPVVQPVPYGCRDSHSPGYPLTRSATRRVRFQSATALRNSFAWSEWTRREIGMPRCANKCMPSPRAACSLDTKGARLTVSQLSSSTLG